VKFSNYFHLVLSLNIGVPMPLLLSRVFMAYAGKTLLYNISKGSNFKARSQSREKQPLAPSYLPFSLSLSPPILMEQVGPH
jgi:hypothetical protein